MRVPQARCISLQEAGIRRVEPVILPIRVFRYDFRRSSGQGWGELRYRTAVIPRTLPISAPAERVPVIALEPYQAWRNYRKPRTSLTHQVTPALSRSLPRLPKIQEEQVLSIHVTHQDQLVLKKSEDTLNLDLLVQTWFKTPERWSYFLRCVSSLYQFLKTDGIKVNKVVCCERQRNCVSLQEFESACRTYGFRWVYKDGSPNLAAAMNLLFSQAENPVQLYVQDDFVLVKNLSPLRDIRFLVNQARLSDGIRLVRYYTTPGDTWTHYIWPELLDGIKEIDRNIWWFYSDHVHLRHHLFTKTTGPYREDQDTEIFLNILNQKKSLPRSAVNLSVRGCFLNIGRVSTSPKNNLIKK